jgi:plastocyanin domain-containing protein
MQCLMLILFNEFGRRIALDLVLNQTTPVEFTLESIGGFQFSCGVGMFHGAIAVED